MLLVCKQVPVSYAENKAIKVTATSNTMSGILIVLGFEDTRDGTHKYGLIEHHDPRADLRVTYVGSRGTMLEKLFPLTHNDELHTLGDILTDFATWAAGRPIKFDEVVPDA